jgi:hypothetical protein
MELSPEVSLRLDRGVEANLGGLDCGGRKIGVSGANSNERCLPLEWTDPSSLTSGMSKSVYSSLLICVRKVRVEDEALRAWPGLSTISTSEEGDSKRKDLSKMDGEVNSAKDVFARSPRSIGVSGYGESLVWISGDETSINGRRGLGEAPED